LSLDKWLLEDQKRVEACPTQLSYLLSWLLSQTWARPCFFCGRQSF